MDSFPQKTPRNINTRAAEGGRRIYSDRLECGDVRGEKTREQPARARERTDKHARAPLHLGVNHHLSVYQ